MNEAGAGASMCHSQEDGLMLVPGYATILPSGLKMKKEKKKISVKTQPRFDS